MSQAISASEANGTSNAGGGGWGAEGEQLDERRGALMKIWDESAEGTVPVPRENERVEGREREGGLKQGFPNFLGRDSQNNHVWSQDFTIFVQFDSTDDSRK